MKFNELELIEPLIEAVNQMNYKEAKNVKITVKDTGKIQKIKVVDERIPEVPDTPQTGYNKSIYLYVLALLFGIGMLAKCLNVKNRYRKKQDEE